MVRCLVGLDKTVAILILGRLGVAVFHGMAVNQQRQLNESYEDVMDALRAELQASYVRGKQAYVNSFRLPAARRLSLLNAAHVLSQEAQRVGSEPRELFRYGALYDDHTLVETALGNLTADQAMQIVAHPNGIPQRIIPLVRDRMPAAIGELSPPEAMRILQRPYQNGHGHPNPYVPFIGHLRHRVKALLSRLTGTEATDALSAQSNIPLPFVRRALHKIVQDPYGLVF